MSVTSIVLLAIGLAMDATAVAAARGIAVRRVRWQDAARLAILFGAFQAGMPLLGWLAGSRIGPWVSAWSHWIAFGLLAAIGSKMLWEAFHATTGDGAVDDPFALRVLLVLAVATSIDAFAVGITLPLLHAPLVPAVVTIGVVTALLSLGGVYAGRRAGASFGSRLDALGGLVLIGLGVKILIQHAM